MGYYALFESFAVTLFLLHAGKKRARLACS